MVATQTFQVSTTGQGDAHDITEQVAAAVVAARSGAGIATVFVVGSTASITTIEFEPGAIADLNGLFERLAPRGEPYRHHLQWGDDNGSSHVRAARRCCMKDLLRVGRFGPPFSSPQEPHCRDAVEGSSHV